MRCGSSDSYKRTQEWKRRETVQPLKAAAQLGNTQTSQTATPPPPEPLLRLRIRLVGLGAEIKASELVQGSPGMQILACKNGGCSPTGGAPGRTAEVAWTQAHARVGGAPACVNATSFNYFAQIQISVLTRV